MTECLWPRLTIGVGMGQWCEFSFAFQLPGNFSPQFFLGLGPNIGKPNVHIGSPLCPFQPICQAT